MMCKLKMGWAIKQHQQKRQQLFSHIKQQDTRQMQTPVKGNGEAQPVKEAIECTACKCAANSHIH